MIVTRTPYRVSLIGGGTDYPAWYETHGGAVLATTINRYCYVSARYLPPFYDHHSRIVYSRTELVVSNDAIEHPAVRGVLQYLGITRGVEIHHHGDLPGRSGIGSSSAFVVGLLHALQALESQPPDKLALARQAIAVEHDVLHESVGCQDQVLAALGGLLRIEFPRAGAPLPSPMLISAERREELRSRLLLFFTGTTRTASDVARDQLARLPEMSAAMHRLGDLVNHAQHLLESDTPMDELGAVLHDAWLIKRGLSASVTTPTIDALYERARRAGALGGKILGAGGGGFLLVFAAPDKHEDIRAALSELLEVTVGFDSSGSQIMVQDESYR